MLKLGEKEGYEFQIFIADDKALNAFAVPGGFLIFNRGMLTEVENIEEIYGVAAHEMAHVTRRHTLRQMLSTIGTYALIQAVFGDVSGILAVMADNSAFLLSRMYSREAEEEADKEGLNYLKQIDVNPNGLVSFFEKLKAHHKKQLAELEKQGIPVADLPLSFLSTHPNTDDRISYLQAQIDRMEAVSKK